MSPKQIARALAGFGIVALVVLLSVTVWVVRHREDAQALQKVAGLVPGSLLHAHNFHWTQMKAGERQWVLTAADAAYSGDKTSVVLTDANVTMVSDDGKDVKITAPRVVLQMNGNRVNRADLSGGTVIKYGDFTMTTDSASFSPDNDRIEAPGKVTLEGEGLKVDGIGLTGNSKTRVFQLNQRVNTEMTPKQKDSGKSTQS
ncbi:MAG: LPS export ABC transporter periplasmic protein LptC [Candidatus Binataceae bacterium]